MKGALGLTIAAALGIVGAVCNWLYLQRLAQEQEKVSFIALRPGVQLNIGDTFDESDLEKVDLPKARYGNLVERAPQWSALSAIVGSPANRVFGGGEIILDIDLEAPASRDLSDTLQEEEVAYWVPITAGSVVADQINPGDLVSFQTAAGNGPTPAGSQPRGAGPQIIGPFRVLALGGRRERSNIEQASRQRAPTGANTITIVVKLVDGQFEPAAAELVKAIQLGGNQGLGVLLHSSRVEEKTDS
jgi:Flp pilus assembly protein CpaB